MSYLQENNLHVHHTFFYFFFAVVLHDYNVKLPETSWLRVIWPEERLYVFLFTVFFFCFSRRSFLPWWKQAFLIFSPPLQNFMLFLQQKIFPLLFLSRSSSFPGWASLACRPAYCFSPPFSFSIFHICGHDNSSKHNTSDKTDTETFSFLIISVFVFDKTRLAIRFPVKLIT